MTTESLKTQSPLNLSALRKVFSLLVTWERWLVLVLVIAAGAALYWNWNIFYVNHTVEIPDAGGELTEGLVGQPRLINPILATTTTDQTLVRAVFSGLYRYDETGTLVPDLALEMPEIGTDSKHYTVKIRPNLTWHDGKALTADDVVFTITQIQNESVQSPLRNLWLSTSVRKLDPLTVVFVTKEVSGPFLHNLTVPLLPEHAWGSVSPDSFMTSPFNLEPLGSGPFAIRQIEKNPDGSIHGMSLRSFASHPRNPYLNGVHLIFYPTLEDLRQGYISREVTSVGLATSDVVTEVQNEQASTFRVPLPQYQAVFFNTKNGPLGDVSVRRALKLALDNDRITKAAWGDRARAINDPPLGLFTLEPQLFPANPAEAQSLLDRAGWAKQANGIRANGAATLSLTLVTSDAPNFTVASQLIADSWRQLGAEVQVKTVPTTELINNYVRPRQYDALLFSQRTGADPDPFAFWHSSQTKDPGLNVSDYSSSEADQLINNARNSTDETTRQELYTKLAQTLKTDVPAVYLNQSLYTYALDADLRGASFSAFIDPAWRLSVLSNLYTNTTRTWKGVEDRN